MSQYDQVIRKIGWEMKASRKKRDDLIKDIEHQLEELAKTERLAITGTSLGYYKDVYASKAVELRSVVSNLYVELEDCEQIISQLEEAERQIKSAGANGFPQQGQNIAVRVPNMPVSPGSTQTPRVVSIPDLIDTVNKLERLLTKR